MEDSRQGIQYILNNSAQPNLADYENLLQLLDYTSLSSSDNKISISKLCTIAKTIYDELGYSVASICVYPNFVGLVSDELKNYPINTTSVAGGFPSAQTDIQIKVDEIKYVIAKGADEIDIVLPRGLFIEGSITQVEDELNQMRFVSRDKTLKVILESGMLNNEIQIQKAAQLAICSGADFIKTSTGKEPVGATLDAHYIMMQEIKNHYIQTQKLVGIKPAGGISTIDEALKYMSLSKTLINETFISKNTFRVGASRLLNSVLKEISKQYNKPNLLKFTNE